jgi:hypothetical protein
MREIYSGADEASRKLTAVCITPDDTSLNNDTPPVRYELWDFDYFTTEKFITVKVAIPTRKKSEQIPGPIHIDLKLLSEENLRIDGTEPSDMRKLKQGLKLFVERFPEIKAGCSLEPEPESDPKWRIKKARYFGYNETTLALLKNPDGQHFLVRCAGYPYGKPSCDGSVLNRDIFFTDNRLHWDDYINDIADRHDNNFNKMAQELRSLGFILCTSADPEEDFEERAEIERFETRQSLADAFSAAHSTGKTSLFTKFMQSTFGNKVHSLSDTFLNTDSNRQKWYDSERLYGFKADTFLSKDETAKLIEDICADFGINVPRTIRFCYPKAPSRFQWKHRNPPRYDGLYYPETTDIALRYHPDKSGFSKHTALHELAHHINAVYFHDGGESGAPHGMRFKRIHMHLMHHYDDIPAEEFLQRYSIESAYGYSFSLREDDIIRRDFNETRTVDILPVIKTDNSIPDAIKNDEWIVFQACQWENLFIDHS